MDLSIRVIALILCCDQSRFASRHPHLSVVQIFKDHRRAVAFTSSAAEKRDYEALSTSRQAFRESFYFRFLLLHRRKTPWRRRGPHYIDFKIAVNPFKQSIPSLKTKEPVGSIRITATHPLNSATHFASSIGRARTIFRLLLIQQSAQKRKGGKSRLFKLPQYSPYYLRRYPLEHYAEKEEPQPQVELAFGLRITNCDPSRPSE